MTDLYAAAGVDTRAGDTAVELMRRSVAATQGAQVLGGFGGFAGLWDASALTAFRRPVLATSTDGVGTKIAIARALDKHDTIGQDLVGMVVDDIVVVGAAPLFMTDYIACGRVAPGRIATIVAGIADACAATRTALIGGETAEHPDLMASDDYDLAGAAVGAVEADRLLGAQRVQDGDAVLALASPGLNSNGYSLVRRIVRDAGLALDAEVPEFRRTLGEELLEPTRLYTGPLLDVLAGADGDAVHSMGHVTGGGIAANLARVLPRGSVVDLDRSTWSPQPVFRHLAGIAGFGLEEAEGTWNLGIGMLAVVEEAAADRIAAAVAAAGIPTWRAGTVRFGPAEGDDFTTGAKGVDGGAVRLVGSYAD
ncbi:phosphoribosylformylglycinamidine cyclo-ligase [uncultured Amnibacterium sp.]|uniref:phosphoribosylformylglycinamidine cyclo-ligase n=1 Tax=uncultured Amnibacterium sp. TaxID=1631851 RepID=UPI0035C95357